MPRRCIRVEVPGIGVARVQVDVRLKACSVCRRMVADVLLCDGKEPGSSSTCDAPLCPRCALHVDGRDLDFCPRHTNQARLRRAFPFSQPNPNHDRRR